MKKILYFSHIDWNWIKQRPQFIAEGLSEFYDVEVIYEVSFYKKQLQEREKPNFNTYPMYRIPKADKLKFLSRINSFMRKKFVEKKFAEIKPDIAFLTYPNQIDLIPDGFNGKIIYDCMDEHSAFINDLEKKNELLTQEKKLVNKANIVLVSSHQLMVNLQQKYQLKSTSNIFLVRNGYSGKIMESTQEPNSVPRTTKNLCLAYIGTVSSWFDFKLLVNSLKKFPNLSYKIIGPVDYQPIPDNDRISFVGTVEHDKLYQYISDVDGLVMPFVLNDVVRAVDPVKLYEYINFNKNIIAVQYEEINRFQDFVNFYSSSEDYFNVIRHLEEGNTLKYSKEARINFLLDNSWEKRVAKIAELIETESK